MQRKYSLGEAAEPVDSVRAYAQNTCMDTTRSEFRKGDVVKVKMALRKNWRLAVVEDSPTQVGKWTLVPFAFMRFERGFEVVSRITHVAQVPLDSMVNTK